MVGCKMNELKSLEGGKEKKAKWIRGSIARK